MNRVSAQNSRDRKKRYVEELEKRLKSLEVKVCVFSLHQFLKRQ